jgi:hypothetical protein
MALVQNFTYAFTTLCLILPLLVVLLQTLISLVLRKTGDLPDLPP